MHFVWPIACTQLRSVSCNIKMTEWMNEWVRFVRCQFSPTMCSLRLNEEDWYVKEVASRPKVASRSAHDAGIDGRRATLQHLAVEGRTRQRSDLVDGDWRRHTRHRTTAVGDQVHRFQKGGSRRLGVKGRQTGVRRTAHTVRRRAVVRAAAISARHWLFPGENLRRQNVHRLFHQLFVIIMVRIASVDYDNMQAFCTTRTRCLSVFCTLNKPL